MSMFLQIELVLVNLQVFLKVVHKTYVDGTTSRSCGQLPDQRYRSLRYGYHNAGTKDDEGIN